MQGGEGERQRSHIPAFIPITAAPLCLPDIVYIFIFFIEVREPPHVKMQSASEIGKKKLSGCYLQGCHIINTSEIEMFIVIVMKLQFLLKSKCINVTFILLLFLKSLKT